ncbi:MAG: hypothetical protein LC679_07535 [Intrasporangiaceae bacterium]|nr:hypothetical protein [Intrasporangiaceae bacterium]
MSHLELFNGDGATLAQRLKAAAQADALSAIVGDAKAHVRTALEDAVRDMSAQTGTAFTARQDGWTALITDPQPKGRVTDRQAFGDWARLGTDLPIELAERVEVNDHVKAAELLGLLDDRAGNRKELDDLAAEAFAVVTDYLLPEDPITPLVESGRCKLTHDALIDLDTGEAVPGVTVTVGKSTLQVRGTKAAKAAERREVADLLSIPAELAGVDR